MDLFDLVESKRFLGAEFLTWLWYRSELDEGIFSFNSGAVELYFDDQLTVEGFLTESEENRFKGGAPAFSPEARLSLRQGKRASEAKLKIIKDAREWTVTFKAETFMMSGIRIPAVLGQAEDDKFYERMYLIEEIESIFDDLFRSFLVIRLSEDWEEELTDIRSWIQRDTF